MLPIGFLVPQKYLLMNAKTNSNGWDGAWMAATQARAVRLWVGLALFSMLLSLPQSAQAQAVSELPRAEYYVARELFRVGRTVEAAEGFTAALNRARRVGERRWIDSVPPLVMLGECFYAQGNLAAATEQYDAALMLAIANPGWIDQIEIPGEQLADLDIPTRGMSWFPKSRPTRSVAVPAGIQVTIDPTQAQVTPQGDLVAPVGLVTHLDVTEVLRTMGVALLRRWEMLGPLGKHSPLAAPLEQLFNRLPRQQFPWLMASWSTLRGLHGLSTTANALDAVATLRSGVLIGDQMDYYLSPLALLALGKLEAGEGNYQAAIVTLQDATLLAAAFEQHAMQAEAVSQLSACAAASGRLDLLPALQQIASWANKHSGSLQISAMAGAAELSILAGNAGQADKLLKQAGVMLRGREPSLPRLQAELSYIGALLAFQQDARALGLKQLGVALQIMRGSVATGAVVESIFQAQLTLDLLAAGSMTAMDAERILQQTLAEPGKSQWELTPLQTLAALTTARLPAYDRWLDLAVARGAADNLVYELMDQIQRKRLYEALPLGGRLLAWRQAIDGDVNLLPPDERKVVEITLAQTPELISMRQRLRELVEQLRRMPVPLDERKLSSDDKRAFAELESLSGRFESQLAYLSLRRKTLGRFVPPLASLDSAQQQLAEGDVVIGLVPTSSHVFGVAISKDIAKFWRVDGREFVDTNLNSLGTQIGLNKVPAARAAIDVFGPAAGWRKSTQALFSGLFPEDVRPILEQARRLILVPSERLWYVPFELLPSADDMSSPRWIERRAVAYVPTLGSVSLAYAQPPKIDETVGVVGGKFFSLAIEENDAMTQAVLRSLPGSHLIPLVQKNYVPSATWLRLKTDQLWVAGPVDPLESGWEAVLLPVGGARPDRLGNWLETPRVSPPLVVVPGLRTSLQQGKMSNGNDILLPACALLFSGTKSALLSRWAVGGNSTAVFLQRYLEELQHERPSDALRRSVLSQWSEQFLTAAEPSLLPAGKDASIFSPGQHPLLWSGYMTFGDFR